MEVEAKFSIPDEQTFQRLLEVSTLAGFSLGQPSVVELHDRYLDTAGGDIQAAGYACRLRREGDRHLATLKGLGGASGAVHRRVELEVELPEPLFPQDWPPSAARDLALHLCGDQSLVPLFEIEQTRYSRPLYSAGRPIASVNLDRFHLNGSNRAATTHLEFEAELLPGGTEDDLEKLIVELQAKWGLRPDSQSKFERGLQVVTLGESPPTVTLLEEPGVEAGDPMSEAGRKTLRFHFRKMLYHEPGTRLGEDIEALHDMRVATRRMRAAFRVFGDYYEPKVMTQHLKGLRRTGRALGAVRDLDVFRAKIHVYLDALAESEQGSLDDLLAELDRQREATRQRMIAYLDGEKYRRFVECFGQFVETEGLHSRPHGLNSGEPCPYRVRHVAPVSIYERLAAVRAYGEWVLGAQNPPLVRFHALRIACKRLRYTLEFFREVLGPEAKTLIEEIVVVQDHLGALQDTVVASDILHQFLARGTWGHEEPAPTFAPTPHPSPGVEAYLAAKQVEMRHLVDTFPEAWQALKGAEFSHMVALAVMVL